jgi:heme-degrading monooxygenase HmoA
MGIKRIWHGWTTPGNADLYQDLLHNEVFPGIEAKKIPGYRGIELLRRDLAHEVEFITIMTFDSLQSVVDFQGEDYETAYVPEAARKVLKRWDPVSVHYGLVETRQYGADQGQGTRRKK